VIAAVPILNEFPSQHPMMLHGFITVLFRGIITTRNQLASAGVLEMEGILVFPIRRITLEAIRLAIVMSIQAPMKFV
jgi:hypothetical protein